MNSDMLMSRSGAPSRNFVYISYAAEDRAEANTLAEALQREELPCWLDRQQVVAGDIYEQRIAKAIRSAGLFLPILSQRSTTAAPRFYRWEWDEAAQRSRRFAA